jgi:hypothetical protein
MPVLYTDLPSSLRSTIHDNDRFMFHNTIGDIIRIKDKILHTHILKRQLNKII